jgi:ketosteroid isomerase-like protein
MSHENVEIVRKVMTLMSESPGPERDGEVLAYFAPDVVIDMSRRVFNPDVYEGRAGLLRLGEDVASIWSEFQIEPERMIEAGDKVVVIEIRRGRGAESTVKVEQRAGVIWTLSDGRVVRMETDYVPDEALKAVGLDE